eukprot:CAMPEP_0182878658 /NCGR_PEP_ID=MMETSP0034_2-20130328/15484_1 /TAXON_ID=156128 /ORGANISM="Nephroselmis pyriformis, Strain CCMP717" /LENGTH=272 /DNA_ID=CAMNT_0025011551 /DNA_START=59 /DNA_END=873 /DNA_ORIENTATION=-
MAKPLPAHRALAPRTASHAAGVSRAIPSGAAPAHRARHTHVVMASSHKENTQEDRAPSATERAGAALAAATASIVLAGGSAPALAADYATGVATGAQRIEYCKTIYERNFPDTNVDEIKDFCKYLEDKGIPLVVPMASSADAPAVVRKVAAFSTQKEPNEPKEPVAPLDVVVQVTEDAPVPTETAVPVSTEAEVPAAVPAEASPAASVVFVTASEPAEASPAAVVFMRVPESADPVPVPASVAAEASPEASVVFVTASEPADPVPVAVTAPA